VLTDDTLPAVARTGPAEAAGEAPSTDLNTHRGLNDDYPYPVLRGWWPYDGPAGGQRHWPERGGPLGHTGTV